MLTPDVALMAQATHDSRKSRNGTAFANSWAQSSIAKDLNMKLAICTSLTALLYLSPAQAQQFEDLDALDGQVAAVLQGSSATAQPVDRRLKLARCPEPIAIDNTAKDSVALRCNAIGWRIRVPLTIVAPSEAKIVTAEQVKTVESSDILVRRGETVEIIIRGNDFEVVTSGVAIEDGSKGKRVRVKSSTGTSALGATVVAQGLVYMED